MIKYLLLIGLLSNQFLVNAQNCNAFKYEGDTLQYEACIVAEESGYHYQFSKRYQEIYDEAIDICPYFSTAFQAKSTAYLKSGDFLTWKKLMDEAVRLNPTEHLGYRGWCRYQFFGDYQGAIKDIEELDRLSKYDIGHSVNGDYHLNIAKAICYKALGDKEKAIDIIEKQLADKQHSSGIYDYLHLGVLYLETKQYPKAIDYLTRQIEANTLAESHFYLAKAYKGVGKVDKYYEHLREAEKLYQAGRNMFDPYSVPCDKVYLEEILEEMEIADFQD